MGGVVLKQESLFAGNQAGNQPLASRVRPKRWISLSVNASLWQGKSTEYEVIMHRYFWGHRVSKTT